MDFDLERVSDLFQLFDAFEGALRLGPAALHVQDGGLQLDLVVDEGDVDGGVGLSRGEDVQSVLAEVLFFFGVVDFFLGGGERFDVFGLFEVRRDLLDVLRRFAVAVAFGLRDFWFGVTGVWDVSPEDLLGVDVDLDLGILRLEVPHVLFELLQDLRALEVAGVLDARPVRIVLGDSWDDVVEEVVIGADVFFLEVVVEEVDDGTPPGSPLVVFVELLLEPVFYRGMFSCVCWHVFN